MDSQRDLWCGLHWVWGRDSLRTLSQHSSNSLCADPCPWPSTPRPLQGDPFKTLFVGRLSFDVTERKLRREFEEYGPIKSIRLVHDKNSGGRISEMSIFKRGEGVSLRSIKSIRLVHR